jgi:hypothetical protein
MMAVTGLPNPGAQFRCCVNSVLPRATGDFQNHPGVGEGPFEHVYNKLPVSLGGRGCLKGHGAHSGGCTLLRIPALSSAHLYLVQGY